MPKLNPLTKKRLRRFIQHRRAFISFLLLAGIYLVSLGSELLCNSKPLLLHFNGKLFAPFVFFYTEDQFLHNGIKTAPDYKSLEKTQAFSSSKNWMLWAPIPFGPNEIIQEKDLEPSLKTICRIEPVQETAVITVNADLSIRKAQNKEAFASVQSELPGNLNELWNISPQLKTAVFLRFNNQEAPAFSELLTGVNDIATAELSLPEYSPRSKPPKNLRITIRLHNQKMQALNFTFKSISKCNITSFKKLDENTRSIILELCKKLRQPGELLTQEIQIDNCRCTISVEKESVRFPFHPTIQHIFGIDAAGRDVLSRLIYAVRTSITFGLALVICSLCVGTIIGLFQGYFGSWIDLGCQRLIEIWSALPFLYVIILLGSIYGPGFCLMLFCYALFNWIGISYYMRAEMLRLKHQPFVEAAKCLGLPTVRIILRHILPNALVPIITFFPFSLVGAIGALAALDYLGFGLPPQSPSIGQLLQQAQEQRWAWWLILYPSLSLFILMLLGVFIGEGARDALDPKTRK